MKITTLKLALYKDKMVLDNGTKQITVYPEPPYSSNRLLVGSFSAAEMCLKKALKQLNTKKWYQLRPNPNIDIHVKEMADDGLSEVEERVLLELGKRTGARKVDIIL